MATFELIQGYTLSSAQASITFSSIPQTYTDLCLKITDHTDIPSQTQHYTYMRFNGNSGANYYNVAMYARNNTALSLEDAGQTFFFDDPYTTLGADTASAVMSCKEIYIPSYTSSTLYKVLKMNYSNMNSSTTTSDIGTQAGLWNDNAPITSINLINYSTYQFIAGTTAFLYGIKNS
jgi:hypothetical protein